MASTSNCFDIVICPLCIAMQRSMFLAGTTGNGGDEEAGCYTDDKGKS